MDNFSYMTSSCHNAIIGKLEIIGGEILRILNYLKNLISL